MRSGRAKGTNKTVLSPAPLDPKPKPLHREPVPDLWGVAQPRTVIKHCGSQGQSVSSLNCKMNSCLVQSPSCFEASVSLHGVGHERIEYPKRHNQLWSLWQFALNTCRTFRTGLPCCVPTSTLTNERQHKKRLQPKTQSLRP